MAPMPTISPPRPAVTGDMSLGLGRIQAADTDPGLGLDDEEEETEHDQIGPAPEVIEPAVPTDDLVRRIAPIAIGAFGLLFVIWLLSWLF